jgi:hypothetical protein
MYKKLIIAAVVCALAISPCVRAEGMGLLLNDDQISAIRANCQEVQSTLTRLHSNDALLRINLAQQYDVIAARLMAPLNSRIALNKLDGLDLAKTTVDYNAERTVFVEAYKVYEQTVTSAIQTNCQDQPVMFYDTVVRAKDLRTQLRNSTQKLNAYIKQYSDQFELFVTRNSPGAQG